MVPLKDRLRFLREKRDVSQIQVASDLGFKPGTYSSYENGVIPKTEVLAVLAKYYDVSMDYLLGLSNERKPAGGSVATALNSLSQLAGESAITATEFTSLVETATKYYRKGAPCGDLPLLALRGFMDSLRAAMAAATSGDGPALIDGANAAVVAALEVTKMPASFYAPLKENEDSHKG